MEGEVIDTRGRADNGMVVDFSRIKSLTQQHIVDAWDHAFLCWSEDRAVLDFLASIPGHKTVILDCVPTAENLVRRAFEILDSAFAANFGTKVCLRRVRLYETPNCWADFGGE